MRGCLHHASLQSRFARCSVVGGVVVFRFWSGISHQSCSSSRRTSFPLFCLIFFSPRSSSSHAVAHTPEVQGNVSGHSLARSHRCEEVFSPTHFFPLQTIHSSLRISLLNGGALWSIIVQCIPGFYIEWRLGPIIFFWRKKGPGGGVLPYIGDTGTCNQTGSLFGNIFHEQGMV